MYVVLKSNNGLDFKVKDGVVSIQGKGVLNSVSAEQLKELKEIPSFKMKVDKGFIILTDKDVSEKVSDDTKQETLDKQTKDIKGNEKTNNVKVEKKND